MPSARLFDIGSGPPAVAVIGADAALAARPATPVQLAHACLKAGFSTAVPASWGDELVATECLRQLGGRDAAPTVFCACPLVSRRLFAPGPELAPFLVSTVPPPVAAARYVRRLFAGAPVRIVYVGACPGAGADEFDARVLPRDFLTELRDAGIHLLEQPTAFDGVIPPDRRRHYSLPGGLPSPERLAALSPPRPAVHVAGGAADLAQHLVTDGPVLLDLALTLGCACAGTTDAGRTEVQALEPPRAPHAIVNHGVDIVLSQPLPAPAAPPPDLPPPPHEHPVTATAPLRPTSRTPTPHPATSSYPTPRTPIHAMDAIPPREPVTGASRKRPTTGFFRAYTGSVPRSRSEEGVALPRAYVSRRRTPPSSPATLGLAAPDADLPPNPARLEHERPIARCVEPTHLPPPVAAPKPPAASQAESLVESPERDQESATIDSPSTVLTAARPVESLPTMNVGERIERVDPPIAPAVDAPPAVEAVEGVEAAPAVAATDPAEETVGDRSPEPVARTLADFTMDGLVASPKLTTEVYPVAEVLSDPSQPIAAAVTREAMWTTPTGAREPLWTTPAAPHAPSPAGVATPVAHVLPIQIPVRSRVGPRIVGALVAIAVIGAGVVFALRHQAPVRAPAPAPGANVGGAPAGMPAAAAAAVVIPAPPDSASAPVSATTVDSAGARVSDGRPAPKSARSAPTAAPVAGTASPGASGTPTVFSRPRSASPPAAPIAAAAPVDERDSIRREIARKQARVDSLQHTFDSLQKIERARKP